MSPIWIRAGVQRICRRTEGRRHVSFDLVWKSTDTGHAASTTGELRRDAVRVQDHLPICNARRVHLFGYVTKWEPKAAKGDVMRASIEIKVTGTITVS